MICTILKTERFSSTERPRQRLTAAIIKLLLSLGLTCVAGCREKRVVEVVGFPPSFAGLVVKVLPAGVNISTTTTVRIPGNPFQHSFGQSLHDPFGDLFPLAGREERRSDLHPIHKKTGRRKAGR